MSARATKPLIEANEDGRTQPLADLVRLLVLYVSWSKFALCGTASDCDGYMGRHAGLTYHCSTGPIAGSHYSVL